MISNLLRPTTIPLLSKLAKFNEQRQQVLAANIAKIDTPDYKTRDLPVDAFNKAMKKAVQRLNSPSPPDSRHFTSQLLPIEIPAIPGVQESSIDELFSDELFRSTGLPDDSLGLQDSGKRHIEHEIMEMTRTVMLQDYAMQMMNSQYDMLEAVISERA